MRIGAVLGVKDEVELIDDCVAHLRAIGVDHVVAVDGGSNDGSLERLERHASERFLVRHYDDLDPDLDAWERVHLAAARAGDTDWTVFLDVDEFWIPAAGTQPLSPGCETRYAMTPALRSPTVTRTTPTTRARRIPSRTYSPIPGLASA